ncbi:MAG: hypothetical protein KGI11_09920, partial [Thaumarchaeota archaeon]|nr:hypothetical protein [Nitrososphaerota archaeon]
FVLLHSNDLIAIANKFNGNFPNASALFPDTYDFNISVNPTEFFDALGRIQPMVNEETNSMGIEYKNGSIVLSTSGSGGSGKDEVAYEGPDKDYRAMYDHKFLTDFFSSVKDSSEKVIFKHKNNERFLVLEHGNKRYLMAQRTPGGK